jgi:hypothetical protein
VASLLSRQGTAVIDADLSRTRVVVSRAGAAVVVARLVYLWPPLHSDEGGYLFVARHWRAGGEFLYGDYHVDRPPLLLAIFRLAAVSDGDRAIRVLAIPFVVVAVLAMARAGFLAAGHRGARWSASVTAALVSSPTLGADQVDGELLALPFVAGCVALTLHAWRRARDGDQMRTAVAAGVLGAAAVLVKQNFLDGLVFALVLVAAEVLRCRRITRRCQAVALGVGLGAVAPALAVAGWLMTRDTAPVQLWSELVSFRASASAVLWDTSLRAPGRRGATLVLLALLSALIPMAGTWLRWVRTRGWRCTPEEWAVSGSLIFAIWAIVGGGSYRPHYLLQLAMPLALAVAVVARTDTVSGAAMRRWARVAVGSTVTLILIVVGVYATVPRAWHQERTGQWLAKSSAPNDTVVVAYGNVAVLETSGLGTPYPYLWSLPMRTLDADQERLRATLAGPNAPTWIIMMNRLNSWGIDARGDLRTLVGSRYDVVAEVCGHTVALRSDVHRSLGPPPLC